MVLPMEDKKDSAHHRRKQNAKNIKTLEGKFCYVLSHDVYMERVTSMCSKALVGRVEYFRMSKKAWVNCAQEHWKPLLTYIPTISLLANGWIVSVFLEVDHALLVLDSTSRVGLGSLVLGRWHAHFDPLKERVTKPHLWVLLPSLPFPLWNRSIL